MPRRGGHRCSRVMCGMKAATCLQRYYEEDQVEEEGGRSHRYHCS